MLRNSFIQFPGVGDKTETKLWDENILTWDQYKSLEMPPLNKRFHDKILDAIAKSDEALEKKDYAYFHGYFTKEDSWRLYGELKESALFIGMHCTSSSLQSAKPLLIGCFDGKKYFEFDGETELDTFGDLLKNHTCLVSFNGSHLHFPVLQRAMKVKKLEAVTIDAKYPIRIIGFSGTAPSIAKQIDLMDVDAPEELESAEAVALAEAAKGGNEHARKMLSGSLEDSVRNLARLMDYAYDRAVEELLPMSDDELDAIAAAAAAANSSRPANAPITATTERPTEETGGHRYPTPAKRLRSPVDTPYPPGFDQGGQQKQSSGNRGNKGGRGRRRR